jgi:hypothetical protein
MKKNLFPLAAALLFFGMAPFFAGAQTEVRTGGERIERGRFGAGESPDGGDASSGESPYKNYRFFLGVRAGPSLRIYTPAGDTPFTGGDAYNLSLDAAFQAALHITPLFSLQVEAVFTRDAAPVWEYALNEAGNDLNPYTRMFTGFSVGFPLMVKLNWYPGKFRVSPFAGGYLFLPLGQLSARSPLDEEASFSYSLSPPLGLLGGIGLGMPLGPGVIFADLRYTADLAEPEPQGGGGIKTYRRRGVTVSLGYELGLFKTE